MYTSEPGTAHVHINKSLFNNVSDHILPGYFFHLKLCKFRGIMGFYHPLLQ